LPNRPIPLLCRNSSLTENTSLEEANNRLRKENKQLLSIFDIATDQFNNLKGELEGLKKELSAEKNYRMELERQNQQLQKELKNERAKANKFADMLFGLKSEKLKLSDIKIVKENTLVINKKLQQVKTGMKRATTKINPLGKRKADNRDIKATAGKFLTICQLLIIL